ncbi:hypothetical protein Tco_1052847, partial [Tanacetum coccineum]
RVMRDASAEELSGNLKKNKIIVKLKSEEMVLTLLNHWRRWFENVNENGDGSGLIYGGPVNMG